MPEIRDVHWSGLGPFRWGGQHGALFALWPAPVDHDACFAQAGFTDFADSDEEWDGQFLSMLDRLVTALSARYAPSRITGPEAAEAGLFARVLGARPPLGPPERLALATHDDQLGPACVEFGAPAHALVCTADGHPIVWTWLQDAAKDVWPSLVRTVSESSRLTETSLLWEHLGPPTMFTRTRGP